MSKVKIDDFSSEITKMLTQYNEEVTLKCKEVVDEVAAGTMNEIKTHCNFKGTGKYIKSFKLATSFEDSRNKRITWHVRSPHYRLTHLLEFGHIKRNGGRTRAFPHVKYGNDFVQNNLPRKMQEAIEECKI